jgi:TonB-linked SusC/RagA family outer membrane protein
MNTMKKYINRLTFLIILFAFVFKGWAQTDTIDVKSERKKGKIEIAYGKQNNATVSSSVSAIKGEELSKSSVTNFGNTLYGKLPGLSVVQGGGEPGFDSPTLRIRGADQAPLVMIDGFERDMTYITPEEIESVSVLKDAAALALYGMKGANGAILITTKRGMTKKGEITFSVQTGLQSPVKTVEVLDATSYMNLYNVAAKADGLQPKYSEQDISLAGTSPRYPDVNWKDQVLKDFSNVSRALLGVLGGSEFIQYYLNVGILYNDGMYKPVNPDMNSNANLTRLNVRSNVDLNISKNTRFSMDLAGSINKSAFPAYSAGEIWNAIFTLPPNAFNVKNPDNSYGGTSILLNNPVAMIENSGRNNSIDHFLNAGFRLHQKFDFIAEGLSADLNYVLDNGANNSDGNWRYFQAKQIAPGVGDDYEYYTYREPTQYNTWSSARSTRSTIFSTDMNYHMPETNGNELDVLVRYQSESRYLSNSDLTPYPVNNFGVRLNYAFKQKYLLQLAASYYGSDHFAEENRYGFFPSVSAGWVLSNENFMNESSLFTFAKLRASYGQTGLNRYLSGRYPFMQFYVGGGGFPLGTGWDWYSGTQPGMLANPDYTWEISTKLNVGIDLEFLRNLSLTVDYYQDKRTDVLYIDYTHPSVSGANLPYENIGKLTTSGIDFNLGYSSSKKQVNWFADLVGSYHQSIIDEMGEALNTGELSHLNRTGHSVTSVFGYEVEEYFESESEIQSAPLQTFGTPRVGDLKYKDVNNDQVIDARDMTEIGDRIGNIDLGLNLGLSFKSFDMEAQLHGQLNRDIVLDWNKLAQPFISGNAVTEIVLEDDFPTLSLSNLNNYQTSSYWIRNGDFVKLRSLEMGYTIPEKFSSRLRINKIRMFLRGVNLLSLSQWSYSDPEFTQIGYPPVRTYYFGLNLNF